MRTLNFYGSPDELRPPSLDERWERAAEGLGRIVRAMGPGESITVRRGPRSPAGGVPLFTVIIETRNP